MRAEGLEPTRSLEHRHLKPACLPFHHARKHGPSIVSRLFTGTVHGVSLPRRLALIALVITAAGVCLALGWWQWSRWESSSGSFQNLGYALQWPAFAAFCIYAYRKFMQYEAHPPEPSDTTGPTELPVGLLPERPAAATGPQDATMREYNAYLAELARADGTATAGSPDQKGSTA